MAFRASSAFTSARAERKAVPLMDGIVMRPSPPPADWIGSAAGGLYLAGNLGLGEVRRAFLGEGAAALLGLRRAREAGQARKGQLADPEHVGGVGVEGGLQVLQRG